MPLIAALLVIVLFAFLIGWLQDQVRRWRTRRLRDSIAALGFHAPEDGDPPFPTKPKDFALFAQGGRGRAHHVMVNHYEETIADKVHPVDAAIFEYTFETPLGRQYVRNWRQTVVRLSSPPLDLPPFLAMPVAAFDMMVLNTRDPTSRDRLLGMAGIEFPEHPNFSKEMRVQSAERDTIRDIFDDALITYCEEHKKLSFEGNGSVLLVYQFDELASPRTVAELFEDARRVYALLATASGKRSQPKGAVE